MRVGRWLHDRRKRLSRGSSVPAGCVGDRVPTGRERDHGRELHHERGLRRERRLRHASRRHAELPTARVRPAGLPFGPGEPSQPGGEALLDRSADRRRLLRRLVVHRTARRQLRGWIQLQSHGGQLDALRTDGSARRGRDVPRPRMRGRPVVPGHVPALLPRRQRLRDELRDPRAGPRPRALPMMREERAGRSRSRTSRRGGLPERAVSRVARAHPRSFRGPGRRDRCGARRLCRRAGCRRRATRERSVRSHVATLPCAAPHGVKYGDSRCGTRSVALPRVGVPAWAPPTRTRIPVRAARDGEASRAMHRSVLRLLRAPSNRWARWTMGASLGAVSMSEPAMNLGGDERDARGRSRSRCAARYSSLVHRRRTGGPRALVLAGLVVLGALACTATNPSGDGGYDATGCAMTGATCTGPGQCCPDAVCAAGRCCTSARGACEHGSECCSATCAAGACCGPHGFTCHADAECCAGPCTDGRCCAPTSATCSGDAECCSASCVDGRCGCSGANARCIAGADCCSGTCTAGFCACVPDDRACTSAGECCSGRCEGGACAGCAPTGAVCVEGSCCDGLCMDGRCCSYPNRACGSGSQCCSGVCTAGVCAGLPVGAACEPTPWVCGEIGECVNGHCCIAPQFACSGTSDCCEGSCNGGVCCSRAGEPCDSAVGDFGCCTGQMCESNRCCSAAGEHCSSASDCCSGLCNAGMCDCAPLGAACARDTGDCCDGTYCGGDGTDTPRRCGLGSGGVCTASSQCIAGLTCIAGTCESCGQPGHGCSATSDCCIGTCASGTCACASPGASCAGDHDCCFGGTCTGGRCCAAVNSPCGANGDCCGGACVGGFCACAATGTACSDGAVCCGGGCSGGRCCGAHRAGCASAADCCTAGDICSSHGCCAPHGSACASELDCCGGSCTDGRCCQPAGRTCIDPEDCCGGSCTGGVCCALPGAGCTGPADCCSNVCTGGSCG